MREPLNEDEMSARVAYELMRESRRNGWMPESVIRKK
jgi:hypothetical protein